jgi:hypothetical protein
LKIGNYRKFKIALIVKGRDHSEDLGIDGSIILKWMWIGFIWFRIGTSGGLM